jgi:hypothetical protein
MVQAAAGVRVYARSEVGTGVWEIDDISIKEIPGNHLTQSTLASRPAYKTDGTLRWLEGDGVDDSLGVTFGDLGASCTVAYVTSSGVTIQTDQTISGAYTVSGLDEGLYGCVIIDRALTTAETASLTAWLNKRAGL